jgi:formamidopyrimidine-DNA glycosylase
LPELPEVETIAADLRPHLVGRTIVRCELSFPSIVRHPEPEQFRRGKYMLIGLGEERMLVVHLGMTGQLRIVKPSTAVPPHTHATFDLDDGMQLRYRDPRRFGRLLLGTEVDLLAARALPRLGPEPIDPDFTPDALYRALRRRRAPLKAVLLDQSTLAGVGNIYADESLYRARIRPDRMASRVSRTSATRLHESLRTSLETAIRNRGSSVDTYRDAWGEMGTQQEELAVYGRGGEPCLTCGRPLASVRIGGRTTVFCRRCQR